MHTDSKTVFELMHKCLCIKFLATYFHTDSDASHAFSNLSLSLSASASHQQYPARSRALDCAADWQLPASGAHLQTQWADGTPCLRPPAEKPHTELLLCFWSWWVTWPYNHHSLAQTNTHTHTHSHRHIHRHRDYAGRKHENEFS